MPSDSGAAWTPPNNHERRLSNSSDGSAGSGASKALSTDSADFLATRPHTASVLPGRPAANPLQFIRVGPAVLGKNAREQLRKAEQAQKTERVRTDHQEDWQSNLDNWKSSRRKRVEHIIERCVEVKRMENEPTQPRAKSKTFNEMLEERAGRRRRGPLPLYTDDDGNDFSDLGIGTSSTKSSLSEDCDAHSLASDGMDLDKNHSDVDNMSNCDLANRKLGSSANEYDTCTTTTISSPEPEEYTYEGAIEGYKSRIISQTTRTIKTVVEKEKSPDKVINGDLNRIRTSVSNKIEEKVSSFQRDRFNNDLKSNQKKDLPKIDIHKRREQFERENSQELQLNKPKLPDIANKKSIKERLSSLEKYTEEALQVQKSTSDLTKLPTEVKPLKERLSSLEKIKYETDKAKSLSNGDLTNNVSVKTRLSSLTSQTLEEDVKMIKSDIKEVSMSIQERLSHLDAAKNKEVPKISIQEEIIKTETKELLDADSKITLTESSLTTNLSTIETQMQSFCRSFDSLDINGQTSPSSFERVQSFEDFDCSEIQNNTVPSDIETEDSGIHTARDSCAPADDIADLTQVASPISEPMGVSEYDSSNEDAGSGLEPILEVPTEKSIAEPVENVMNDVIEEQDEQEQDISKTEDSDSGSNYLQAVSQPIDELSATDEITEIQLEKDDDDTLKSLENHDTSVSLNEPVSTHSEGDTVVFEGKMTIHVNLNELCNNMKAGAGNTPDSSDTVSSNNTSKRKSMPMVIDALELAFKEIDSEDSFDKGNVSVEVKTETKTVAPLYENIEVFYQNNGGIVDGSFPLDLPSNVLEPPKEKPPPPPVDDVDDELLGNGNFKHTSSARRIKKEIRNKRTSFLGIEADDSYLDVDLTYAPRPDITSFLQEETKIEKLLYKKTLDVDSKLRESRDSGVDVDRGPSAEAWYNRPSSGENSNQHSRQNSEPYNQTSTTSEDEEQKQTTKEHGFTSDLNTKLENLGQQPSDQIDNLDKKIQEQQRVGRTNEDMPDGYFDHSKEVLRFERELLQLEQEELRRQREKLRENQTRIIQKSVQDVASIPNLVEKPPTKRHKEYRHSMPNLLVNETFTTKNITIDEKQQDLKRKPFVSEEHMQRRFGVEESRKILYDDVNKIDTLYGDCKVQNAQIMRPPQPVLPPKPKSRESIEREITMRSSRVPSAVEYVNIDKTSVQLRPKPIVPNGNGQYHPMSRHTLQALSAAPTPKLISNSEWMQAKSRKPPNYNYNHHWLIQEAEHRRIEEQRNKMRLHSNPGQRHSYHHDISSQIPMQRMQQLSSSHQHLPQEYSKTTSVSNTVPDPVLPREQDKILSVSGKRKCSHCGEELGRGAAMIIESLSLCYHVWCFTCAVCGTTLGDGKCGADVRVRAGRLHCHHCYSGDDGRKYSQV